MNDAVPSMAAAMNGTGDGSWERRSAALRTYFDRTAVRAWETLTTDAPVSGVRAKVRAGRGLTRATLLDWLPADLTGMRVLDAGCGTGALAVEAAARGAEVLGIDISPNLVEIGRRRLPEGLAGRVHLVAGDMLDVDAAARAAGMAPRPGETDVRFDAVVAMDSLIHYRAEDVVSAVATLGRCLAGPGSRTVLTFAPATPLLVVVKAVGKLFPKRDRSPAIAPVGEARLVRLLSEDPRLSASRVGRTHRVKVPFYVSQCLELVAGAPDRDGSAA